MPQVQDRADPTPTGRRTPVSHSQAVQEAKRLEKTQTVSSSHRTSGAIDRLPLPVKDAAR